MIFVYLKILAVLFMLAAAVLFSIFADRHRRTRDSQPAVGRATVVQTPDVARHRAGAKRDEKPYRNPLPSWVRQSMAPTANDEVALPAGPTEETGYLAPPRRDDMRPTLRHLAANERATEAERALAQGLLNVHEQEATQ